MPDGPLYDDDLYAVDKAPDSDKPSVTDYDDEVVVYPHIGHDQSNSLLNPQPDDPAFSSSPPFEAPGRLPERPAQPEDPVNKFRPPFDPVIQHPPPERRPETVSFAPLDPPEDFPPVGHHPNVKVQPDSFKPPRDHHQEDHFRDRPQPAEVPFHPEPHPQRPSKPFRQQESDQFRQRPQPVGSHPPRPQEPFNPFEVEAERSKPQIPHQTEEQPLEFPGFQDNFAIPDIFKKEILESDYEDSPANPPKAGLPTFNPKEPEVIRKPQHIPPRAEEFGFVSFKQPEPVRNSKPKNRPFAPPPSGAEETGFPGFGPKQPERPQAIRPLSPPVGAEEFGFPGFGPKQPERPQAIRPLSPPAGAEEFGFPGFGPKQPERPQAVRPLAPPAGTEEFFKRPQDERRQRPPPPRRTRQPARRQRRPKQPARDQKQRGSHSP